MPMYTMAERKHALCTGWYRMPRIGCYPAEVVGALEFMDENLKAIREPSLTGVRLRRECALRLRRFRRNRVCIG